jgi:hypothetical protein
MRLLGRSRWGRCGRGGESSTYSVGWPATASCRWNPPWRNPSPCRPSAHLEPEVGWEGDKGLVRQASFVAGPSFLRGHDTVDPRPALNPG